MQDAFNKKVPPMSQAQLEELKRRDRIVAVIGIVISAIAMPLVLAAVFASLGVFVLVLKWLMVIMGG